MSSSVTFFVFQWTRNKGLLYIQSCILGAQSKKTKKNQLYKTFWNPNLNVGERWRWTWMKLSLGNRPLRLLQEVRQAEKSSKNKQNQQAAHSGYRHGIPPPNAELNYQRSEVSTFPTMSSLGWVWTRGSPPYHYCKARLAGCQPLGREGGIMFIRCWSVWSKERRLLGWAVCFAGINYSRLRPLHTLSLSQAAYN